LFIQTLAIWLSQESIIIIDYCAIDQLLRDRPIVMQSTDCCAIGGSVECAAQSADSAVQSPDRANRLSANNTITMANMLIHWKTNSLVTTARG